MSLLISIWCWFYKKYWCAFAYAHSMMCQLDDSRQRRINRETKRKKKKVSNSNGEAFVLSRIWEDYEEKSIES